MTLENFGVKVRLSESKQSINACYGVLYQGLSQLGIRMYRCMLSFFNFLGYRTAGLRVEVEAAPIFHFLC